MTDRRAAESETRFLAAVVASVSDAVITTDREAQIVYLNAAAETLFGVRLQDVVGLPVETTFVHPDDRPRAREWQARLALGETLPPGLLLRLCRADGSQFTAELGLVPVSDEAGAVVGLAAIARDVTARLAADAEAEVLRAVVQAAAEGIVGIDERAHVRFFSPAAERLYGYRADEVVGRSVELLVAERRVPFVASFMARLAAGETIRGDTVARRRDGSEVEISVSAQSMFDADGRSLGAVILVLDITERQRAQRLLERIVRHSPVLITVKDLGGHYRLFNFVGAQALGLAADEVVGRTDTEIFPRDVAERFIENDREVLARGEPVTFNEEFGGRQFISTKFPIPGVGGRFEGVGLVSAEVTDMRRAEADQARLAALVQSAPDAIIAQDPEGRITTWNPGAEAMFGFTAEEAIGRDYAETLVPESDRECFYADREEVRSGHAVSSRRVLRMRADGSVFPARVSGALVQMPDGTWSGTVSMVRDITELAAAEVELEARAAQLERSNADLERFAYAASHDLQEPLQSIKLSAGAVLDAASDRLDEDERELLSHIDAGASRLSGQIRGLMEVARVALGAGPQERVTVEVAVQDALDALRAAASGANAQIDVHRPLPQALVPRTELSLVLQNLVANGIKYHRSDVPPRITVSGSTGETYVEIRVADNGIGLSENDRVRVFGVFERASPDVPGTGMGLATAQRMVERHGGTIGVASAGPGRGSEFTVRLPLRG